MGSGETKSQKQIRTQTAYTAAHWWRELLDESEPRIEAGMSSFSINFITAQHNRMKEQITPEQVEAFEKSLKAVLEKQLAAGDGRGVTLHIDYDPDEPLAAVMHSNGIPPRIFPPHTWMQVEQGWIRVRMGGADAIDLPLFVG